MGERCPLGVLGLALRSRIFCDGGGAANRGSVVIQCVCGRAVHETMRYIAMDGA